MNKKSVHKNGFNTTNSCYETGNNVTTKQINISTTVSNKLL